MMRSRELMAKKVDAFVLTNLLKAEPGGEPVLQESQRRLLQAGKEAKPRQEYCRRTLPAGVLSELEYLSDLLLGELVHVVKDEQRRRGARPPPPPSPSPPPGVRWGHPNPPAPPLPPPARP